MYMIARAPAFTRTRLHNFVSSLPPFLYVARTCCLRDLPLHLNDGSILGLLVSLPQSTVNYQLSVYHTCTRSVTSLEPFLGFIIILMDNRYRHTGRIAVVWQRGFAITWDFGHFGAFFVSLFLGFILFYTWLRLPPHLACPAVADHEYDELADHVWNLTANFTELVNRLNRRLALPSDNQAISS